MAPQLRALPGQLQALALLPLHHAAISARVDRALAENPAVLVQLGRATRTPVLGTTTKFQSGVYWFQTLRKYILTDCGRGRYWRLVS
jgi:hypothetical protein